MLVTNLLHVLHALLVTILCPTAQPRRRRGYMHALCSLPTYYMFCMLCARYYTLPDCAAPPRLLLCARYQLATCSACSALTILCRTAQPRRRRGYMHALCSLPPCSTCGCVRLQLREGLLPVDNAAVQGAVLWGLCCGGHPPPPAPPGRPPSCPALDTAVCTVG